MPEALTQAPPDSRPDAAPVVTQPLPEPVLAPVLAAAAPAPDAAPCLLPGDEFGKDYLQRRIVAEFPLARHMAVEVESADANGMVLIAPLAANANYKGTAFGGSLFSLAVLTGWAWITRYLAATDCPADAVIQESTMRYLSPVQGSLRASLVAPSAAQIEKFRKMLQRAGRGRIRLEVHIHHGENLATVFEGIYAAAVR